MTKRTVDMNEEIQSLNDYQHARLRTEMYLSSRDIHTQTVIGYGPDGPCLIEHKWVPAVFTAFREVLDNAVDEVVSHGFGDQIDIRYDEATTTIWIADNGRGIPIAKDAKTGKYKATMALSETKAGRNFKERGSTRGMNGVGASIVNMCSEYFKVEIFREEKSFTQEFTEGADTLIIGKPKIKPSKKPSGTHIEYKLSPKVFPDLTLSEEFVAARVYELALSYPNLKVMWQGKKVSGKGGVDKLLFSKRKPILTDISVPGFHCRFWFVPSFFEDGTEHVHGMVNAIPLLNGGNHIDAYRRCFAAGLLKALEPLSKRKKLTPNRNDVMDGSLLYSIVEMDGPSFDSQSKTRLINENTRKIVTDALADPEFFKEIINRHKDWIEAVYARCAERTMKKDGDDLRKAQKTNARLKIEELQDASGTDRQKCSLFLCEGKSAVSGITEARDATIHGALPLRGKVMNVYGKHLTKAALTQHHRKVAENDALKKIASAIGLVVGQKANRLSMRYGRVYLATDADPDGANIAALLVNYFYQYWPELFEKKSPLLHIFQTPFIIATKGKVKKYWYSDDHVNFKPEEYRGWEITRAKGLAALEKEDWLTVLKAPRTVPVIDNGDLDECLDLLFSPDADRRKVWLGE
jgi:DNA gyrase/topoisomerase IV subunit B